MIIMNLLIFLNCFLFFINCSNGYKILGIFPTVTKSDYIAGSVLMKGLAEAGHKVTIISPFTQGRVSPNYREVNVNGLVDAVKGKLMLFKLY